MLKFSDLPRISIEYDEFYEEVESYANDRGGSVFQSSSEIPEPSKQELSDHITDRISTNLNKQ